MKPMFNRAPLNANFLSPLPLGAIKPEGWLLDQLRTQAFGKDKEHHGVHVLAKVTQVDWPMDDADAAAVPMAPKAGPRAQVMELVPFGDTCLRIAQFPVCAMPAAK